MNYFNFLNNKSVDALLEGLNRDRMPQIDSDQVEDLKEKLSDKGIVYTEEKVYAKELIPIQENYDPDKVANIKKKVKEEGTLPRLIVSEDYSILDGHHRWKAVEELNKEDVKVPVLRIHLPQNKALINLDDILEKIESPSGDYNIVSVYPGRFQPFHRGHKKTYQNLRDHFGKGNTYIATSDKSDSERSPFNFEEKKRIITKLFRVPKRFVVKVKSPYNPKEVLENYDEDNTVLVVGLGEKDAERLSDSKYYEEYSPEKLEKYGREACYDKRGFYFTIGHEDDIELKNEPISGSNIRELFRSDMSLENKKKLFKHVFGRFDKEIFSLLIKKLKKKQEGRILDREELEVIAENIDFNKVISEVSQTKAAVPADDGPASWYSSDSDFETYENNMAKAIGYEVVDYILGSSVYEPEDLKQDALKFVSFFPTGVMEKHTEDPLESYYNFSEAVATGAGYEVLEYIGIDDPDKDDEEPPELDGAPEDYVPDEDESPSSDESETTDDENMGGIASLDESIRNKRNTLLFEGGGFGHLNHPYEDRSLTFEEFADIIKKGFSGELDRCVEKTDGQNLKISWIDGELRASRNKGHIKNSGKNSLDIKGIAEKFDGRGEIQNAFVYAMRDLSNALSNIPDEKLEDLFRGGNRFLSLEVIYPPTQNVIPYGRSLLVFHGMTEYDFDGNPKERYPQYSEKLYKIIQNWGETSQEKFNIIKQPKVKLPDNLKDKKEMVGGMVSKIDNLRDKFGLSKGDKIVEYHEKWWENFIKKKAKKYDYNLSSDVLTGLVKRWVYRNKSGENGYSVRDMKNDIDNDNFLSFVRKFDKNKYKRVVKKIQKPFEIVCLKAGAEILKNADYKLAEDSDKAKKEMKNNLKKCIKKVSEEGSDDNKNKMKKELRRLKKSGGVDAIVPCEGIVFQYGGDMYKFTGAFASINQIMGILRYNR